MARNDDHVGLQRRLQSQLDRFQTWIVDGNQKHAELLQTIARGLADLHLAAHPSKGDTDTAVQHHRSRDTPIPGDHVRQYRNAYRRSVYKLEDVAKYIGRQLDDPEHRPPRRQCGSCGKGQGFGANFCSGCGHQLRKAKSDDSVTAGP